MKFTCPKCDTRYTLADDKVPPAPALRFTCKKCGNVMRVRKKDGAVESEGQGTIPQPVHESTRVASLAEIHALASASAHSADGEWHVMLGGQSRGPYALRQLAELRRSGQLDERTHVWRDGLGEWQRAGRVADLAGMMKERLEPAVPEPIPEAQTRMMSAAQLQAELDKARAELKPSTRSAPPVVLPDAPTLVPGGAARGAPPPPPRPTGEVPVLAAGDAVFESLLSQAAAEQQTGLSPFDREPSAPLMTAGLASGEDESEPGATAGADEQASESYRNAPPGEATKLFMSTAGLFRRRRNNRIAAAVAAVVLTLVVGIVILDLGGVFTVPGMGLFYDVAGVRDPNLERAVARVESKLQDASIGAIERETLRRRLLGLQNEKARTSGPAKGAAPAVATQRGIVDTKTLTRDERSLAADIFSDERKKEIGIKLVDPADVQMPNLPAGLTQEAIYKVINDNARSTKLCLEEAFKKGEKPQGRMEVQVTIAPTGTVAAVAITSPQFRSSAIGSCTIRRIKGWRFPRWNGEPVTVEFPYVLSAGF